MSWHDEEMGFFVKMLQLLFLSFNLSTKKSILTRITRMNDLTGPCRFHLSYKIRHLISLDRGDDGALCGSISTVASSWSFTVLASPPMPDCWAIANSMTRSA
jgi:hypothetical protein